MGPSSPRGWREMFTGFGKAWPPRSQGLAHVKTDHSAPQGSGGLSRCQDVVRRGHGAGSTPLRSRYRFGTDGSGWLRISLVMRKLLLPRHLLGKRASILVLVIMWEYERPPPGGQGSVGSIQSHWTGMAHRP